MFLYIPHMKEIILCLSSLHWHHVACYPLCPSKQRGLHDFIFSKFNYYRIGHKVAKALMFMVLVYIVTSPHHYSCTQDLPLISFQATHYLHPQHPTPLLGIPNSELQGQNFVIIWYFYSLVLFLNIIDEWDHPVFFLVPLAYNI